MESCVLNRLEYCSGSSDTALVADAQCGNTHAMEYLLYKYRNVVRNKVRHFFVRGADQEDLLQVGMIGLWQAVIDYSPHRSISFLSFAKICIERHVITAIKSSTRKKQCFLNEALSLDQCAETSDMEVSLGDILAAPKEMDPEEQLLQKERLNLMNCSLQTLLSTFEWEVLKLHNKGKSYCEIAEILGCKAKSVDNALGRIRRKLECSTAVFAA